MTHADLIVVGGGLGGISCALRARELGLRVTVLEASTESAGWSNSRMSGARYHAAGLHPEASPDEIVAKAASETDGHGDMALTRSWAETCGRSYLWLRASGIRFALLRGVPVMAPIRPNRRGEVWVGYGADTAIRRLRSRLHDAGGEVRTGVRAMSLKARRTGGWSIGTADTDSSHGTLEASAVVLADGGFQADLDLLATLSRVPQPAKLVQRGAGSGRGDGLRMGLAAGGQLVNPDALYAHLIHAEGGANPELRHYPMLDRLASASLVVDRSGRRICDERIGGIGIANRIARLDDPTGAWAIFDTDRWETAGRFNQIVPPNPNLQLAGARLESASRLEGLALPLGVPRKALRDSAGGGSRVADGSPQPIELVGPVFAVPLAVGLTFTMGGLAIGRHAEVLDASRRPIDGLYAIGGTTGGISGGPKPGYVGGLSIAVALGLLASESAAGWTFGKAAA